LIFSISLLFISLKTWKNDKMKCSYVIRTDAIVLVFSLESTPHYWCAFIDGSKFLWIAVDLLNLSGSFFWWKEKKQYLVHYHAKSRCISHWARPSEAARNFF
jgi:hypothetical protein